MPRDDFKGAIKEELARRASYRCSNPSCGIPTIAASGQRTGVVNIGVAAHITAAAVGGPRYNHFMTPIERSALSNGIWLCQSCSVIIDKDSATYSEIVLHGWRAVSEQWGRNAQRSNSKSLSDSTDASVVVIATVLPIDLPIGLDGGTAPEVDLYKLAGRLSTLMAGKQEFKLLPSYACVRDISPFDNESRTDLMDSFELVQFKSSLFARGDVLARSISILFSNEAHQAWGGVLTRVTNFSAALSGLVEILRRHEMAGQKFDLWSIEERYMTCSIYLSDDALKRVLSTFGYSSVPEDIMELAGTTLDATSLPPEVKITQVIPRICHAIALSDTKNWNQETVLLNQWNIGLG